jgi:predicted secreted Zn-dependent protease
MGAVHAPARRPARSTRHGSRTDEAGCAPGFDVAANPATIGTLMRNADAGTRERLATSLQRRHGNAAVQRLLEAGMPLQRWAVNLPPATTDCARVVAHLDATSPHRATSGWAKTSVRFNWGGDPAFTESDGVITATVANPTVTKRVSVDMPQWAPSDPAMSAAWGAMVGTLRAHEAEHERIASEWETTLTARLASLSVTVSRRTLAAFNAAVQAEWSSWLAEHQAAQDAIDPFTAILDCSAPEEDETSEDGGAGAEGETVEGEE